MTTGVVTALPHVEDQDLIDRIIGDQAGRPGALLGILEKLQDHNRHKYLPMETLEYVAIRTGVPQSQVYGVATFYALFNLEPQGTHTVAICRGTACHTRGSRGAARAREAPARPPGGPRRRRQAHRSRRRTGGSRSAPSPASASARSRPVVEVDHAIRGHVKEQALMREVDALRKESAR